MKKILWLIFALLLLGCTKKAATTRSSCGSPSRTFEIKTEEQALYYALLEWAFKENKQQYCEARIKCQVYIRKKAPSFLTQPFEQDNKGRWSIMEDTARPAYRDLMKDEIPSHINGTHFCLKTDEELQTMADRTGEFHFLTISQARIKGNIAYVQIEKSWQRKSKAPFAAVCTGGNCLKFVKTKGKWEQVEGIRWN